MRLKIHNINKVQDADIKLDGLTVIAGANGSGKSTVGKLLFSVVKSMANAESMSSQSRERRLRKRVSELYNRASGCFPRYDDSEIDKIFPLPSTKMVELLIAISEQENEVEAYLENLQSWIESKDLTPRIKSLFAQDIDNIRIAIGDSQAADIASESRVFIESEFMGKICSLGSSDSSSVIEMNSPENNLTLSFKEDAINSVRINYNECLSDATYVESPLYLHILDTLLYATTYREYQKNKRNIMRGMVPIHIKDLAEKLYSLQMVSPNNELSKKLQLSSVMGGQFIFDNESRTLKFKHSDVNLELSPINIASGIKSFGLIQILTDTQVISNNKILIWDEPENHLHPRWQIAFAEVLVQLSKSGIPVVISTHSPYFVQGIRYFSAKHDLVKYTNYYLAEEQVNHLSVVKDVTNDLNQVFSKLAEPLSEIMNVDMVRKTNKS